MSMEIYTRNCPVCNKEISHRSKYSRNQCQNNPCQSCAAKDRIKRLGNNKGFLKYTEKGYGKGENNPFFGKKHTEETKLKFKTRDLSYRKEKWYRELMSAAVSGSANPMYGRRVFDVWVSKYGLEVANKLSEDWKLKQKENSIGEKNPMYGKSAPQGSGNGWSGWYKGFFFRSLRELAYMVDLDAKGVAWTSAEKIKIKYINWNGAERTYCPDFLVQNELIEIKPTRLRNSKLVLLKEEAAKLYCKNNNMIYKIVDPKLLSDEKIKSLRQNGVVKFTKRYEQLYQERYI